MKIDNNNNIINLDNYVQNLEDTKKTQQDKNKKQIDVADANKNDQVIFTNNTNQNQNIMNMLKNVSDIREDKIIEIRNRIENSTYNVRGEEVGEKILLESYLINKLT